MNIQNRLNKIERNLNSSDTFKISSLRLLKLKGWKYQIANFPPISLSEWQMLCKHELETSHDVNKTQIELEELKERIKSHDGFMEIEFIEDIPEELKEKYELNPF